jgi:DNA-binding NarL/FixJ family response regulator
VPQPNDNSDTLSHHINVCSSNIHILIVDDHRLFAEGLVRLLETIEPPLKLSICHDAQQAIELLKNNRFDLLLFDLFMPGIDGLELLKTVKQRHIKTPVAIISSTEDIQMIQQLMTNGASGFIPKSANSAIMLQAVTGLLNGDVFLPDALWDRLNIVNFDSTDDKPLQSSVKTIGERQLEVLTLMSEGKTNKQISTILAISEATVKYHIGVLFKALCVKNRTTCVSTAQSLNLI